MWRLVYSRKLSKRHASTIVVHVSNQLLGYQECYHKSTRVHHSSDGPRLYECMNNIKM